MRAIIYGILWAILTTLVCYYIYSQKQHTDVSENSGNKTEQVQIINEVENTAVTEETSNQHSNGDDDQAHDDYSNPDSSAEESSGEKNNTDDLTLDERSESPNKNNNEKANLEEFLEKAYIEFNPNSSKLPKNDLFDQYLDSVATIMQNENVEIVLVGHADSSNSRGNQNYEIGLKRAEFIKNLLTSKNVSGAKIQVMSEGDSSPRINGNTAEAKKLNRRVELFIKQKN